MCVCVFVYQGYSWLGFLYWKQEVNGSIPYASILEGGKFNLGWVGMGACSVNLFLSPLKSLEYTIEHFIFMLFWE